jgi:hypothetical protein
MLSLPDSVKAGFWHASNQRHLKGKAVRKASQKDDAPQRIREHNDGLVVDYAHQKMFDHGDGFVHFVGSLDVAVEESSN